jgi:hypothetical protein
MSYTDDFLKGLQKRGLSVGDMNSIATGDKYTEEFLAGLEKRKKKKVEQTTTYKTPADDDIGPVKEEEEEEEEEKERKWFQSGVFEDGYQFGDINRALTGTLKDVRENLVSGVLGIGEGVVDAGAYIAGGIGKLLGADQFADKTKDFIAKELVDEEKIAKKIVGATSVSLFDPTRGHETDDISFLGEKSDALLQSGGQLLGTAGLQAAGVPWFVTTGLTSFGSEAESAFKQGASYGEAGLSAAISAGAEILTEKISGGIKFGGKTLDDGLTKTIARNISNKTVRTLSKLGMDMAGEGTEEVLSGVMSAIGQKITYADDKELSELFSAEDALEAFIGGAVLGGGGSTIGALQAKSKGVDFVTELTADEQKVVDKVYQDEIAGKNLSEKEKGKIYDRVLEDMDNGRIDTDTIESVLGGESYSQYDILVKESEEFNKLYETESGKLSERQKDRLAQLKAKNEATPYSEAIKAAKEKLTGEVSSLPGRFAESYNEKARRGQAFEADLTKYDAKQQKTIQKAIDSGILNNTRRTHEFVDMIAKISADKGVSFDFTNNQKLKESGFAIDGKQVNGFKTKDGVTVNLNSAKSLNSVVGHEITHVLEGTALYNELAKVVTEYAKVKGEYKSRYDSLAKLYEGIENANVDAELVADLVGDYLFTDSDFVSRLSTENRNVFQKIYDEIKYLVKTATAGSPEAKKLLEVQRAFEKAYKAETKNTAEGGVKYALTEYSEQQKKNWAASKRIVIYDSPQQLSEFIQNAVTDKTMDKKMYFGAIPSDLAARIEADAGVNVENYNLSLGAYEIRKILKDHGNEATESPRGQRAVVEDDFAHIVDVVLNPQSVSLSPDTYMGKPAIVFTGDHNGRMNVVAVVSDKRLDLFVQTVYVNTKKGNLATPTGEQAPINTPEASSGTVSKDNVAQKAENVKYSLSDSEGRQLSPAVQKRFAKSKVVGEDGNLKPVFHGTASGEFTIFDKSKGSVEGDFGSGFYFTDNGADVSEHYEGGGPDFDNKVARRAEQIEQEEDIDYDEALERAKAELFKGSHKFEVYLNIENPAIVGKTMLLDSESYMEQYSEDDYDDYDDYIADVEQLVADDIDNIVWEVEKNVDVDNTEGLANVLYEAYYEGGIGIEELKAKINELYLEDSYGNLVGNEVTRQIIESLGYDGIIDPTVSGKWNMDIEEGTTHYIVFKPNQIKSVTNENPTDNPDIHLSLSAEGKQAQYGNYNVYGKDIALETAEDIAPVAETAAVVDAPLAENVFTEEEIFPDAPIESELERLQREIDALNEWFMNTSVNEETMEEYQRKSEQWYALDAKIKELQQEADNADAERLQSIEETDAPPETETVQDEYGDVELSKNAVREISKTMRHWLGLSNQQMAEARGIIERYSQERFPAWDMLYDEIAQKFGKYTEKHIDEELKEVKKQLRTYGIKVDPFIKSQIADFGDLQKRNFGKVRFSKEGLAVDSAYQEFQEMLPGYFPDSIDTPTDQLMRIIEVANMETEFSEEYEIDHDTLAQTTDAIINGINEYKSKKLLQMAHKQAKEAAKTIAKDEYAPIDMAAIERNRKPIVGVPVEDLAPTFDTESGQQAMFEETEADRKITRAELHQNIMDKIKLRFAEKGFDLDEVLKKAKNLSTFATVDNTPQRVMEKALGWKEGKILSDVTVDQVARNETEGIKWLNSFTDRKNGVLANISKKYNIKPGSKESKAAQMYAEGFYVAENDEIISYGDKELAKDFPDAQVQRNIKGLAKDPQIRQIYDATLDAINKSRKRNAYPEIPRLDNYFLHFRAMEDTFSRLGLPFNPNDIRAKDLPTDLNGVTADLKPGQPYFASAKHREGKRTSFDLLGGLEMYLNSAKNQIYHIDDIQTLRALRNYIADDYGQAKGLESIDTLSEEEAQQKIEQVYNSHLSTFAKFLNEEANVIAGKTALIDRGLEGVIGRRGITFLETLNRQVGANMVGFNVSSSMTNFLSVVQAAAKTNKFDVLKAFTQTVASKVSGKADSFIENNPTVIRRKGAEKFHRTMWQKAGDAGYALMSAVDNISTELIVRAKYNELTRKGMSEQDAIMETDKWVSRMMGDRSMGQQPQIYNSKMLGMITKFQLEVRNQLDAMVYDTIQEANASNENIPNKMERNAKTAAKVTSTFVQLAVLQHLFGKAFESVAGYNPSFDIISAIIKAFGWDDDEESEDTVLDNIEQGFLELLGDLPYTSTLTGGRIPIASALPIEQFVTGKDSYGNEKSRWETAAEALPYYLLPGGYGQAKKTIQGLGMFDDDLPIAGSYTDSGNLRFPVEDTLGNKVQAAIFGQWASENARDYFDNEWAPLKEKQIEEYAQLGLPISEYRKIREDLSKFNTLAEKANYIGNLELTSEQKNILVNNLTDRKGPIDMTNYGNYGSFEEFDYAQKNPEKYEFLNSIGVSYEDYANADDDAKGAYNWAFENPEKYKVSKVVTDDVTVYRQYTKYISKLSADKDQYGDTISGSKKEKVAAYINELGMEYGQKIILFKSQYPADDTYNYDIVDYLSSREDVSYEDAVTILKALGFEVHDDGRVTWD